MRRIALPLLLLALAACDEGPAPALPPGQWSGQDVNLFVGADGAALELTCRSAALPASLPHRFQVDTVVFVSGVTISTYRAAITGSLDGKHLHLTVTSLDAPGAPEEHDLVRRPAPHLPLCG